MCGIAGVLGPKRPDDADLSATLARSLAHRGPDGEGVESIEAASDRRLLLVHRRLAILDLSDRARQPMRDPVTGDVLVFNGEIFNFRAIRAELESLGERFTTTSDTEVLLRAYAHWGVSALERVQGMFAFALWDASERKLILAVDPLGIKPLYWRRGHHGELCFASEVRALLDAGLAPRKADPSALESYLAYGAVQGPATAIAGVRSLQAGTWLAVSSDGTIEGPRRYWAPAFMPEGAVDGKQGLAGLPSLLDTVAREHLESDVQAAVFLSGGVDSTALAAFCARYSRGLKAFSVVFADARYSEAVHARAAAKALGLEHVELTLSAEDLLASLPAALGALDQPTLDGTNVFVLSKAVRAAGIKVALSGQGGDEVFGGYSTFRLAPSAQAWRRRLSLVPAAGWRAAGAAWSAAQSMRRALPDKLGQFLSADSDIVDTCMLLRQVFAPSTRRRLLPSASTSTLGLPPELERELRQAVCGLDPIDAVSYIELRGYLGQMLLRDGDVMSMAHGLEVRVPFLDRRVVDAVAAIPGSLKLEKGRPKPLLLDAAGGAVPKAVWARPKQGFTFPWESWLRGPLRPMAEEAMRDAQTFRGLGLDPRETARLWEAFAAGKPGLSWSRIWALVALREWAVRQRVSA